jgi:hypothetical protein
MCVEWPSTSLFPLFEFEFTEFLRFCDLKATGLLALGKLDSRLSGAACSWQIDLRLTGMQPPLSFCTVDRRGMCRGSLYTPTDRHSISFHEILSEQEEPFGGQTVVLVAALVWQ